MYQVKDEKAQGNLEKKHPYENLNKQVGCADPSFAEFPRLQGKVTSSCT